MLQPKKTKFRKQAKGRNRGLANVGNKVSFGDFGLKATTRGRITARQIEAGRVAAQHFLRRQGKIVIRVFPDKPISKKPLETRMGKGKAETDFWAARVKPGTILFEISGVPEEMAKEALARIAHKMPVRCRFVGRRLSV